MFRFVFLSCFRPTFFFLASPQPRASLLPASFEYTTTTDGTQPLQESMLSSLTNDGRLKGPFNKPSWPGIKCFQASFNHASSRWRRKSQCRHVLTRKVKGQWCRCHALYWDGTMMACSHAWSSKAYNREEHALVLVGRFPGEGIICYCIFWRFSSSSNNSGEATFYYLVAGTVHQQARVPRIFSTVSKIQYFALT